MAASRIRNLAAQWLSLDLRSLALWRICLGLLVLLDLAIRLPDLGAHYTDLGICSRGAMALRYPNGGWSFHMMSGGWGFELFLFALHALFAVAMVVGYRTFLANALTWLFLVSLGHRNLAVFDCGDFYLRMLLLWGLFLPLGKRWSLDALHAPGPEPNAWFGPGAIAYPAQVTMVYVFAALWKDDPVWTRSHTAVYLALSLLSFASPRAAWLLERPQWMEFLTVATLRFELIGPIFLWLPGLVRLLGVASIACLHAGLGTFIHLGIFPLVGMAATLGLLPGIFWDRFPLRFVALRRRFAAQGRRALGRLPAPAAGPGLSGNGLLCYGLLLLVFIGNVNNHRPTVGYDAAWNQAERAIGLDQCWNMFAPYPPGADGWYVIDATRCDGSHFDLFATLWGEHQDLTWQRPRFVASTFPNARWRKLMEYMREETVWRQPFAFYLTRLWNLKHLDRNDRIYSFNIYFMEVATPPVGQARKEPVKRLLWSHQCYSSSLTLPDGKILGKNMPERTNESIMQNSDY